MEHGWGAPQLDRIRIMIVHTITHSFHFQLIIGVAIQEIYIINAWTSLESKYYS